MSSPHRAPAPPVPLAVWPRDYAPAVRARSLAKASRVLLIVFLVILMTLSGLLLLAAVTSATGVLGFLIGLCLALLPLPVVLGAFRWVDRYEPEPAGVLAFLFFWGATVAALISAVLNTAGAMIIASTRGVPEGGAAEELVATAVFVAPWVEEAAKGMALLAVFLFSRREFDGIVDGIVFAGMVGIGFAFSENILYFGRAFLEGSSALGTAGGISAAGITFLLRGVFSPFAHPLFTVLTGIGLALAVSSRHTLVRLGAPVLGYLGAVALHATWNASAAGGLSGFITGYVVIMVPAFFIMIGVATWSRRREGRVVAAHLPAYVAAGWLAPADVNMVASLAGRRRALLWARGTYGEVGQRALREFQYAATELAFLRDRAERGTAGEDFPERERELLEVVARARAAIAPPPTRR